MDIGRLWLDGNLLLSPMAGFSDVALRVLCRRAGAAMVCSEMVHSSAVVHENARTKQLMRMLEEERPVCIQLFGHDVEQVAASAAAVKHCDMIGFNFGCPAHQIKAAGCGAALLDDPSKIASLVEALRSSTSLPLLIKMRIGNMKRADYVDIARRIERAGADALIVHGRTAADGYSGHADWSAIKQVVDALSISVIANGDVVDGPSAKKCLVETGAAGIAIGRGALGDPSIFRRIRAYLDEGVVLATPTPAEKLAMFRDYLDIATACELPSQQILQQALTFTKGIPGGAKVREKLAGGAKDIGTIMSALAAVDV